MVTGPGCPRWQGRGQGWSEKYLPRLDSQSEEEFAAYVKRASFFSASAPTPEACLALILRWPPFVKLPEGGVDYGEAMREFANDVDRLGTSLTAAIVNGPLALISCRVPTAAYRLRLSPSVLARATKRAKCSLVGKTTRPRGCGWLARSTGQALPPL